MYIENESPVESTKSRFSKFGAPITKGGRAGTAQSPHRYKSRVLRPVEFRALLESAAKETYTTWLEALLVLGMRYVEAERFQANPDWLKGRFVFLPFTAVLKEKRTQLERWVKLSDRAIEVVPRFLSQKKLPCWSGFEKDMKRWALGAGLDPVGLSSKTTRKTWESWLMSVYPERANEIFLNQGHNSMTALRHYLNLPFVNQDRMAMKTWTDGWVEAPPV